MPVTVVDDSDKPSVTFADLFALPPPPPGHIVILGSVAPEQLTEVDAEVTVTPNQLAIVAFGAQLALDVRRLVATGASVGGWGTLTVADRASGARFLEGLARTVGREPPPAAHRLGELERATLGVSATMTDEGLVLHLSNDTFWLRVSLPESDGRGARLQLDPNEIASAWDEVAAFWCRNFRDGRPPRPTRAEDPSLSGDDPWIVETKRLTVPPGTDMGEAAFGGDTLFAFGTEENASSVLAWPPGETVPRTVAKLPKAHGGVYPSPDGQWVAVVATLPGDDGSLTHGASSLALVEVGSGQTRTLATKDAALRFGDTSEAVAWASDGTRFAFYAKIPGRDPDAEERGAIAVFDVGQRQFVDILVSPYLMNGWCGAALNVQRLVEGDDGADWEGAVWRPGEATPVASDAAELTPNGRFRVAWTDAGFETSAVASGVERALPVPNAATYETFAAGQCLVSAGRDARVIDLETGALRYVAHRGSGVPSAFATFGTTVLFRDDDDSWRIGRATAPAPKPLALRWPAVVAERVALAAAYLGNDVDDALGDLGPGVRAVVAERRAQVAFHRGEHAVDRDERVRAFTDAVAAAPDWRAAREGLASAKRQAGDFQGMLEVTDAWLRVAPDDADAHFNQSIALQNLGRYDEAVAAADRSIEQDDDVGSFHYQRACALALGGRLDEAIASVTAALERDPDSATDMGRDEDLASLRGRPDFAPVEAAGLAAVGLERHQQGHLEAARDAFRRASRLAGSPVHLQNWCILARHLDDHDDVLEASEHLLTKAGEDGDPQLELVGAQFRCMALLATGRHLEALPVAEAALRHGMPSGGVLATFARVFGASGKVPAAVRMLEGILAEAPGVVGQMLAEAPELEAVRASPECARLTALAEAASQTDEDDEDDDQE